MSVKTWSRDLSVTVGTLLLALTTACGAADEGPTGASSTAEATLGPTRPASVGGDAAVWALAPDQNLDVSSTKFTALVSRLGCNGGVTGEVLAPEIQVSDTQVLVTFSVVPAQPGDHSCQGNAAVPYDITLAEPLHGRSLVDGQCLPGRAAATTSFCMPDSVRLKASTTGRSTGSAMRPAPDATPTRAAASNPGVPASDTPAQPISPYVGIQWNLVRVEHSGAAYPVPSALDASITFGRDDHLTVNDSLNPVTGRYTATPTGYTVTAIAMGAVGSITTDPATLAVITGLDSAAGVGTPTPRTVTVRQRGADLLLEVGDYRMIFTKGS